MNSEHYNSTSDTDGKYDLLCWNLGGLLNKWNSDFRSYLNNFSVISLVETWITEVEKHPILPNYTSFVCPAEKHSRFGRGEGGVAVYAHKSLVKYVRRLDSKLKHSVFLLLSKSLFGTDKDIILGNIYIHPYHLVRTTVSSC